MREKLLDGLIYMATERRWIVLIVSMLLTLGLGAASEKLTIDMRWMTLLPESLPVAKEFKKIDENFLQPGNMIIAISGPDPVMLERITDEATEILQKELVCDKGMSEEECIAQKRYARRVYGKLPEKWLTDHVLRLAKPKDVKRMSAVLQDPRLLSYLVHTNSDLESEYTDSENVKNQERQIVAVLDAVQGFVETLDDAAEGEVGEAHMGRTVRDLTVGRPYMFSLDNTMSLIMVAPSVSSDNAGVMPLIDKQIEKIMTPLVAQYPEYRIERTGMIAIGRDEMDSIGIETTIITLIALVLIFGLLAWNFRSALTPVLCLIPIVLGIVWSVGFIALTLGEMNIVTSMIMVVLLGLGIDFSIHVSSRFHEEMGAGKSVEESLRCAIGETGKGVITGAVTTAAAFYTLMIADTKGISQFGFCSGTGVLITLLAVLWMLPSLLAFRAVRRAKKHKAPVRSGDFSVLGAFAEKMGHWRRVIIAVSIMATIAGLWALRHLDWEWNFMNLEPEGLRSVELQDEIIEKYKFSVSVSMLTADSVEESRALRKKFREKRIVGEVDDISQWVSRPDYDKSKKYIEKLREALTVGKRPLSFAESNDLNPGEESAEALTTNRAMLADELDRLWANIVEIQALSFTGGQDRVVEKTEQLVAIRDNREKGLLRQVANRFKEEASINWGAFDHFSRAFGKKLRAQALQMAQGDEPVVLAMVPEDIVAKYTSDKVPGFMMQVLPKENLFHRWKLETFQDVVTKVDPSVTGFPQLVLNMNLATLREGSTATLTAIFVILIVLLIDFRRPLVALLAFLPLISGLALTFGVMWLWGEKINYINMIGLPVIIGIGVDDGVHFFHRFIREGKGGLGRAVTSVGRAMLMTSLTTMIGFGSLMLYMMRGMASLGFVLFVGVGMCFVVTITLLPALAKVFEDRIIRE